MAFDFWGHFRGNRGMSQGSKPSRKKRRKKPLEIKRGSVTVKVYPGDNRVNGAIYPQFTLIYYDRVVRKKRRFADVESATREAGIVAESLAKGENHRLHLTAADASVYADAISKLRPFNILLNVAIQEYISALKNLPAGSSLKDAVDFFRKRHLAPITDNLLAWLEPHAKKTGKVADFERWWNEIPKVADAVNAKREMATLLARKGHTKIPEFVWKHNAMRHSFCSYRLAAVKNTAQVALEAGNSPQMIHKHYQQLVTEAEAAKWFAIIPAGDGKGAPPETPSSQKKI
jgi:hypothetical protein